MIHPIRKIWSPLLFSRKLIENLVNKSFRRCLSQTSISSIAVDQVDVNQNELRFKDQIDLMNDELYPNHVRLNCSQKMALTIGSAMMSLYNPYRDDMIATFGEVTGHWALSGMREKMLRDPEGRKILEEKPRINSKTISIDTLGSLPSNTFGYAYYRFLKDNGVSPDTRKQVQYVDDVELAYVCQRYREVHDLVHTLLSMPTNMLGEVLVKWVEAIQTNLPLCWTGGLFGAVRLNAQARKLYKEQGLPWALDCGHRASNLMCVYFEKRFEQDFYELRRELNIPEPPEIGNFRTRN